MNLDYVHPENINITNNFELKKFYTINGKVEGEYIEYHNMRPEKIYKQCKFVNGLIHGKYYEYHTNNKIYTMCNYINGKIEGSFRQYYSSGKQYRICNYINNNIHGEYKEYYNSHDDNRKLKIICNYNNGKKEGSYIRYFKTERELGSIEDIMYYKNGKLNGELISYHINGKIRTKMQYTDNRIVDTYYIYDEDGNIISVYNFIDNKRTDMILYKKDGTIKHTGIMIKENYSKLADFYSYNYEIKELDETDNEILYEYEYLDESIYKKKFILINDKPLIHLEMPVLKTR
jgi:antitoxin component YwqK of YwqJK toxin-antitoxin module